MQARFLQLPPLLIACTGATGSLVCLARVREAVPLQCHGSANDLDADADVNAFGTANLHMTRVAGPHCTHFSCRKRHTGRIGVTA